MKAFDTCHYSIVISVTCYEIKVLSCQMLYHVQSVHSSVAHVNTKRRNYGQGRCWPNGCPKQVCIVVPPAPNIMEVKKKKPSYYRGQNRTLIKY